MRSGVPLPRTSYRVVMPSMTAVATLLRRRFAAQRTARAQRVVRADGGVDLDEVRPAVSCKACCGAERGITAGFQLAHRHVAAHERARDAAPHGLADEQHLLERDVRLAALRPQRHADRI